MEFWKTVLFTDESKFNLLGSRAKVWRKPKTARQTKNLVQNVKHWGAIGAAGLRNLAFIDGIMEQYLNRIEHIWDLM